MRMRGRRFLIGLGLLLLAMAGVLALLEWDRRRQVAAAGMQSLDAPGTVPSAESLTETYSDPEEFAELCAAIQKRYDDLRTRFFRSRHTRKARVIEYDRKGQPAAILEITDRIHFVGERECKEEIDRRQLLGKTSPFDPDALRAEQPSKKAAAPFTKDSPEGLYRYNLEGVEELQGRLVLRIHFEPTKPIERSFTGWAWIDPTTREPVRMRGSLAKTPLLVDRFEMLVDYGLSENGSNQVRHVTIEVRGGFAFVSRHFRIESELSDYRALAP